MRRLFAAMVSAGLLLFGTAVTTPAAEATPTVILTAPSKSCRADGTCMSVVGYPTLQRFQAAVTCTVPVRTTAAIRLYFADGNYTTTPAWQVDCRPGVANVRWASYSGTRTPAGYRAVLGTGLGNYVGASIPPNGHALFDFGFHWD